jgi:hypothetical protein
VVNICGAIVAVYVILEIVDFEPHVRQFFIALVIAFLCIRVTWILYSALVINVLMGYDLDKALQMKKIAWSILNVGVFHSAAKVIGHGGDEASTVASSGMSGAYRVDEDDAAYTKAMAKFSKSKNSGDLQYEIDKIKKEIADRQSELACLENMKFASDHSGGSSSGSKNSSHIEAAPPMHEDDEVTLHSAASARKSDGIHMTAIAETSSRRRASGHSSTVVEGKID